MIDSTTDCHDASERAFDVKKPPEDVTFLGLLDGLGDSGHRLTALFDWKCRECGQVNRDAVVVEPQQGFLARWSCGGCAEVTVLRFRARASADWIAEHTLAVTGSAFCHLAESEPVADTWIGASRHTAVSQRLFALIAIPALAALVLLGLSDLRRLASLSASPLWGEPGTRGSTVLSRLPGSWRSEDGRDELYVSHVDEASQMGTYIRFSENRRPGDCVRFAVVQEESNREQLVIRQWRVLSGISHTGISAVAEGKATLCIPLNGKSLTWTDSHGGRPTLKVYHRANDAPAP
ncbi:MAG: hypothetical protein GXY19_14845 [Phycisphaerae bacterium]|nr:hypothetical protein [Phycisphaerae bacterium]